MTKQNSQKKNVKKKSAKKGNKPKKRSSKNPSRKIIGRTEEGYPIYEKPSGPDDCDWGSSGYKIGVPGMPY